MIVTCLRVPFQDSNFSNKNLPDLSSVSRYFFDSRPLIAVVILRPTVAPVKVIEFDDHMDDMPS